jgi:hypothetical protein
LDLLFGNAALKRKCTFVFLNNNLKMPGIAGYNYSRKKKSP